eukprot:979853-Pyramimonas_sp.AAC.1
MTSTDGFFTGLLTHTDDLIGNIDERVHENDGAAERFLGTVEPVLCEAEVFNPLAYHRTVRQLCIELLPPNLENLIVLNSSYNGALAENEMVRD